MQVGSAYRTEKAAKSFSHYIAQCQRQQLVETVKSVKFFSLLLDGSTDAANVENELILVMLFDKEGVDEKVVTHSQLLKVCVPSSGTAESLFHAVTDALKVIGVASISKEDGIKMIGIATDGVSSNIAKQGLKG